MKLYRQTLALLLAAALLAILSGCASQQPSDAPTTQGGTHPQSYYTPSTPMTVSQARKTLAESIEHLRNMKSVRDVQFYRDRITFVGDLASDGKSKMCSASFAEMENLSVADGAYAQYLTAHQRFTRVLANGKPLILGEVEALFDIERDAALFIYTSLILKKDELTANKKDKDETGFAMFTASAQTWLAATPKPEMSEEARTYKVLAEDAFKRKDFPAALDAYGKALEKYPMWPSGHYNAALLAAESEDYELAAQHMRRYLVLSPDAKDAQAAKDKLLLWQAKAKE
jgi:tetratricopeptide (TPR) repeat protein